jgi:hypothetical protein
MREIGAIINPKLEEQMNENPAKIVPRQHP